MLKSKPKMGPKNGVRKPAQKSVALTVASPVAEGLRYGEVWTAHQPLSFKTKFGGLEMMEEAVGPVDEITQLPLIEQEVLEGMKEMSRLEGWPASQKTRDVSLDSECRIG